MAHVGVQRFCAGDGQHHRGQRDERHHPVAGDELRPVARRERLENSRFAEYLLGAGHGKDGEPQGHHRAEQLADQPGAVTLDDEQYAQHRHRDRQHQRGEPRGGDLEPLYRRQHRDRRGDDPVAVEQRRPEDPQGHQYDLRPGRLERLVLQQRGQGHDAALAAVVGPHDEGDVLDRDDDHDRPENQRDDAVDLDLAGAHRMVVGREHRLHRIQRAGADVAEHHPQRTQRQPRPPGAVQLGTGAVETASRAPGRPPARRRLATGRGVRRRRRPLGSHSAQQRTTSQASAPGGRVDPAVPPVFELRRSFPAWCFARDRCSARVGFTAGSRRD